MSAWARAENAIAAIARGEFVVVINGTDRDSEGDLVMAASRVTARAMAFLVRHCSGLACVALRGDRLDALNIPQMIQGGAEDSHKGAFAVSVDVIEGTTTGISATDRAATARALADPKVGPADLARPGHVLPLRASSGGVLMRPGRIEAAVDLAELAGEEPAGLLCELMLPDGSAARRADLEEFAGDNDLVLVSIEDLIEYRLRTEVTVERLSTASIDTPHGPAMISTFRDKYSGTEHLSVEYGSIDWQGPVLVRMHAECLAGDIFASQRCDCRVQLDLAQKMIADSGGGVVVYLRGYEGRNIDRGHTGERRGLQDAGLDTDANIQLGIPDEGRDCGVGAAILEQLGAQKIRLLADSPNKSNALIDRGIEVIEHFLLIADADTTSRTFPETKRIPEQRLAI